MRLVEQTTASWEFWFGLLEQFVECNGHARVPQSYTVDGYPLGWWVSTQRSIHRRDTLDAERQHRLQDLPGWTWDPSPTGGRRVSVDSRTTSNATVTPASRSPTRSMATRSVSGSIFNAPVRERPLDADRQLRLEDLPGWTWDTKAYQWEEGFSRLLDYVERHGHARVPQSYSVDGFRLGRVGHGATSVTRQAHP